MVIKRDGKVKFKLCREWKRCSDLLLPNCSRSDILDNIILQESRAPFFIFVLISSRSLSALVPIFLTRPSCSSPVPRYLSPCLAKAYSPLWGCAGERIEMVVKVHSGTVLGDAFSTWRQICPSKQSHNALWQPSRPGLPRNFNVQMEETVEWWLCKERETKKGKS